MKAGLIALLTIAYAIAVVALLVLLSKAVDRINRRHGKNEEDLW